MKTGRSRSTVHWAPALLCAALACALVPTIGHAQRPVAPVIEVGHIRGTIDTATARYAMRVIDQAERRDAQVLVFTLDTPGGYDSAMRAIVQRMLGANLPVVVFVSPLGARAGSAGVFITLAADVAAMAPGTNIGAAHPVNGAPGASTRIDDPVMAEKITNDAAAYARALAQQRHRNADWAEHAVRESDSIPASEALRLHVVDDVTSDLDDLLSKLDGRKVTGPWGERTLRTRGGVIFDDDMNWFEQLLQRLIDPNVAYVLFTIGTYAILAELYNPGAIIPAVVGGICMLLAMIAFGSLPVNWGGFALLVLAAGFFLAEIKFVSHGLLGLAGVVSFVLGSVFLFPAGATPFIGDRLDLRLVAMLAVVILVLFGWILRKGLEVRRQPALASGPRTGEVGVAATPLVPVGAVRVHNELWSAVAQHGTIARGAPVRVVRRDGLLVRVEPTEPAEDGPAATNGARETVLSERS